MNARESSRAPGPSPPSVTTPSIPGRSTRPIRPEDREPLVQLISRDGLFTADEIAVALELIEGALAARDGAAGDYHALVAELDGVVRGYVCYGPTPMTEGTWDLYWIVSAPEDRGTGVGRQLVAAMEAELRARGARRVRVETSSTELYGAAQRFYLRIGYPEIARIPDFYRPGDDLIILFRAL